MLQQFLQLLVWVRERPEDYCSTIGELGDLLHQLYDLCAAADGNANGFRTSLSMLLSLHEKPHVAALLTVSERDRALAKGDATAARLIAFWTSLDQMLAFPSSRMAGDS
jgi:hypothetical protein